MVKKIQHIFLYCILALFIFLLAGALLPYIRHKTADPSSLDEGMIFQSKTADDTHVICIDDNMDALVWRLRLIDSAKENIILSTFDFMTDESGTDIISALCSAAERGVNVRVIADGMTGLLHLQGKEIFEAMVSHPNITVKFYNPIHLLTPWTWNARLHDKYLIADSQAYIVGGRNLYNLFLGEYSDRKNVDRDFLIWEGNGEVETSADALCNYFEKVWNQNCSKTVQVKETSMLSDVLTELKIHYQELEKRLEESSYSLTDYSLNQESFPVNGLSLAVNPIQANNKKPVLWKILCDWMKQGDEVVIQTPYIVCSKQMYQDLEELTGKVSSVSIITNAIESGANPWGCMDYLNEKTHILQTGVTIYESLGAHSLHKKTILIDDTISIIGSYNMDMRSTYLDTEIMVMLDCPQLNALLRVQAAEDMTSSRKVTADGAVEYGENYQEKALPEKKRIIYPIMRYILKPFRYLL